MAGTGSDTQADYLKYLYQGSELLLADKLAQAREVLETACGIDPQDAKGLSLLALVYFRLEEYDRALDLYGHLVHRFPKEAPLRVNLGLVYMKRGDKDKALAEMLAAVEHDPAHKRAYGYLGLLYNDMGEFERAKEYFDQAGQEGMARRMQEAMDAGESGPVATAGAAGRAPAPSGEFAASIEAERISREISREITGLSPEPAPDFEQMAPRPLPAAGGAAETSVAAGGEAEQEGEALPGGVPLFSFATDALIDLDTPPARMTPISETGLLFPVIEDGYVRAEGLFGHQGELDFARANKRSKGQSTDQPMEDERGHLLRVQGNGVLLCSSGDHRLTVLDLFDDFIYLRTRYVFAFEAGLHWENGRVRSSGKTVDLVHIRGEGRMAVATPRDVHRIRIVPDTPNFVSLERLVGWVGRVMPQISHEASPTEAVGLETMLRYEGEGVILVMESTSS